MPTYQRELGVALSAVREAAVLCRAVQKQIAGGVLSKKDRSPVTVADFGSQALVCRALHEAFPSDPVIAEEDSAELRAAGNEALLARVVEHLADVRPGTDAEAATRWIDYGGAKDAAHRLWTLDPIDGTKGFLRGEQYAIALALIVDGELALAALACPNLPVTPGDTSGPKGVVLAAVAGEGAFCAPLDGDAEMTRISVSRRTDPSTARLTESVESGHSSHGDSARVVEHLGIQADPVRLDSQCKYAVVARGEADVYMRLPTRKGYTEKIWDHAAGVLVVREAGGKATDVFGRPLDFGRGWGLTENTGVIVTNGPLHGAFIATLATLDVGEAK
jgi:3'(2'), 5'-bisphosphate nucleotidase